MAHFGGLERERAAAGAGPQPAGDGEGGDEADRRGAVLADVGELRRRELVVADEARDEQHDDGADDAR